ncbi:nuclear egress membrane protein [Colobine gammaherpesvirus 1]|uniref:Nuclear egress membrane protein n=1 Tax=Colobine gammaherpesvirus 1 TaxID=2597325 RepID=A0A5B8G927_9GAMA|nr:nuclear egress membrane protein [Colobine gammaherpesvirus 1]QDQ69278.1 nuclear egress membrane protein [Colobine gammaherpesvirus 1]
MNTGRRVVDELCRVVSSYLGQPGQPVELERCYDGAPVYAKGASAAVCTVKLEHGCIYHLEFVYKFWLHMLRKLRCTRTPCFVISNNGLSTTLRCFVCRPQDATAQFGRILRVDSDVYLAKNSSVVLGEDDFTKFKAGLVFSHSLNVYNSMVICRTYFTDYRQVLQFLVVTPKSHKRLRSLLDMVCCLASPAEERDPKPLPEAEDDYARTVRAPAVQIQSRTRGVAWLLPRASGVTILIAGVLRRLWPWLSVGLILLLLGCMWTRTI